MTKGLFSRMCSSCIASSHSPRLCPDVRPFLRNPICAVVYCTKPIFDFSLLYLHRFSLSFSTVIRAISSSLYFGTMTQPPGGVLRATYISHPDYSISISPLSLVLQSSLYFLLSRHLHKWAGLDISQFLPIDYSTLDISSLLNSALEKWLCQELQSLLKFPSKTPFIPTKCQPSVPLRSGKGTKVGFFFNFYLIK